MQVAVAGLGNTGQRVVQKLLATPDITQIRIFDPDHTKVEEVMKQVGHSGSLLYGQPLDVLPGAEKPQTVVLSGPARSQLGTARPVVEAGMNLVSISDHPGDVKTLLGLDEAAKVNGVTALLGAGFCPGLSGLLVRYGVSQLEETHEINVATAGTGGPACARQHHWALKHGGLEWSNNEWNVRRGMSGRDLVWFPEPIGANDCYRAALASPLLLQQAFPEAQRIGARMSANRRDRMTGWLPMLRSPHDDGGPGAIRAEVRGRLDGQVETLIYGVSEHPSVGAAMVASACVRQLGVNGQLPTGAYGLASISDPSDLLIALHDDGIRVSSFDGYLKVNA